MRVTGFRSGRWFHNPLATSSKRRNKFIIGPDGKTRLVRINRLKKEKKENK